jgi:hypothetical protein
MKAKMIKNLFLMVSCISLISCSENANTKPKKEKESSAPSYTLPYPPLWGTEIFSLPPAFAPSITYKGMEDIRFAPGWAKSGSNEYWTYAFLWKLEDSVHTDATVIETNLKAYYTGLIARNTQKSKISTVSIPETVTKFEKTETLQGDAATFNGTIRMLDYMMQQPITLNCKVHLKYCPGQNNTYLFHELSPKPFTDSVWKNLQQVWAGFACAGNK